MIDKDTILAAGSSAVAIMALLKLITDTWSIPTRYNQLIALIIGAVWVPVANVAVGGLPFQWAFIVVGVMTGLSATGMYEVSGLVSDAASGRLKLKKFVTYKDPATGKFVKL